MKKVLLLISIMITLLISSCSVDEEIEDIITDEPKNKKILFLGDSLTAGYGLDLEDSYPSQLSSKLENAGYDYEIINAGVSGNTSSQLLSRMDLYLDGDELPSIAILVIGGNDGLRGKSLEDLENNINSIIDKLKDKNIKVVLGGMKVPPRLGLKYTYDFGRIFKRVANEQNVEYLGFFLEGVALDKNLNLNDGFHPNKAGYEIISDNVFNYLEKNNLIQK